MKKIFIKKSITFMLAIIPIFFIGLPVESANLYFEPHKETVGIEEEFYLDLKLELDSDEIPINGIKGLIDFPSDKISFLRAENGKSIIDLWVKKPSLVKGKIEFAGVSSYGFDGVIDPFNLDKKLPGLVTRLIFVTKKPGGVSFEATEIFVNLKNGEGTEIKLSSTLNSINIREEVNSFQYNLQSDSKPKLEAKIIKDPNLFNSKNVLIFEAFDKETGIKDVSIKEGRRNWKEITSPYLLKDQDRSSIITVRATNFSGNSETIIFNPISTKNKSGVVVIASLLLVFLSFVFIKKFYVKNK